MGGSFGHNMSGMLRAMYGATEEQKARDKAEEAARIRAAGGTPLGEGVARTMPMYTPPTQTSQYANPIPQYQPSRFDFNPYAAAYQQQFNSAPSLQMPSIPSLPPMPFAQQGFQGPQAPQMPSMPQQPVIGLQGLARMYGIDLAAPQNATAQDSHSASIAAAANTTI